MHNMDSDELLKETTVFLPALGPTPTGDYWVLEIQYRLRCQYRPMYLTSHQLPEQDNLWANSVIAFRRSKNKAVGACGRLSF
jgi:hypothetical protein